VHGAIQPKSECFRDCCGITGHLQGGLHPALSVARPRAVPLETAMTIVRRTIRTGTVVAVALAIGAVGYQAGVVGTASDPSAPERDMRVYGSPRAAVFQEDYSGPPMAGDAVSVLPELAPLRPGNRTHHVRVDITAQRIEVAPGVRFDAWTFGGVVPGPVIHVREGDRIVFTMKNRTGEQMSIAEPAPGGMPDYAQLATQHATRREHASEHQVAAPMAHSIDFHAAMVAPDDKYRAVKPGETIRFEWVANYPGVYTYHCGVPPILQHMSMGQYGIVVVSPRYGYPTDSQVSRSYAVVQSEFYLKKREDDDLYRLDWEAAQRKLPSHVTFNGHVNALKTTPLTANAGDRVRIYFHNIGPSDGSSAHVVGTILDRVWYEGNPANEMRGLQTVFLGASNGAVMEFIVPEEGEYILVDHEFADAQRGAVGKIRVASSNGQQTRHATMEH
jgi:nitrite reductase (NO-forming)